MEYISVCFLCFGLLTSVVLANLRCESVSEIYVKRISVGALKDVPLSPTPGAVLKECASTLQHTHGSSCCNSVMEKNFMHSSEGYLREHIQMINSRLKTRITNSTALFQEHLQLSVKEAQNRMSEALVSLYKIPKQVHKKPLDDFFSHISHYLNGEGHSSVSDIIDNFFKHLFPHVYDYVILDASKVGQTGKEFHSCLMKHFVSVQPFGNIPLHLGKKLSFAFQRARMFAETLKVMIQTMNASDKVTVDDQCRQAVSRLQYCSMCSAQQEARPCRGLCINVMRGCLSKISELSSSWDELVVSFEKLYSGMSRQNTAQELLAFIDSNVTEALLQASEDGPRIYREASNLCRNVSGQQPASESGMVFKKLTAHPHGHAPSSSSSHHSATHAKSMRSVLGVLLVQLEESKGFLHRIADGLCKTPIIYDQEMQSETCWNGSTVGRYMRSVPEAHIIRQVQDNPEVKVSLVHDPHLIQMKDVIIHMNKNISVLFSEELMLNDDSYKAITGSGDGVNANQDVTIDDEDFDTSSGDDYSGSGDDATTGSKDGDDRATYTPSPDPKGPSPSTPRSPHRPNVPDGRGGTSRMGTSVACTLAVLYTVSRMLAGSFFL